MLKMDDAFSNMTSVHEGQEEKHSAIEMSRMTSSRNIHSYPWNDRVQTQGLEIRTRGASEQAVHAVIQFLGVDDQDLGEGIICLR